MNGYPIAPWKKTYMRIKHAEETASEMAKKLGISECKVYSYCKEIGVRPKPSDWYLKNRAPGVKKKGHGKGGKRYCREEKQCINRPPAQYSNENVYLKYSTDENID